MAWKGIVGRSFTADQFRAYVAGLKFTTWRPQFVVVHNTAAPTLAQWHGATPPAQRIKNLERYYRDQQKWSAGPHLFIADDVIWVFTPLTTAGVHSPSWNSISLGFEMVGDFDREPFDNGVRANAVAALGIVHAHLGIDPGTIRLHKEDPKTTHACPGKNVVKGDLIKRVRDFMAGSEGGERPADEGGNVGVVKTAPNDPLNMRDGPNARAKVLATLKDGAKLTILGAWQDGGSRWLQVAAAGKTGWVSSRYVTIA